MAKVAFLGLGVMGFPMAGHLAAKGHEVTVYNRTFAKAEAWTKKHKGKAAKTPKEAATGQEIVFSCVGNDEHLRAVVLGPDGAFAGMEKAVGAISKGAAQSWQMDNSWKAMVEGKFEFGFAVDWMRKDLGISLAEGKRDKAQMPLVALVDQFYARVQERGGNRWDTCSLIQLLQKP